MKWYEMIKDAELRSAMERLDDVLGKDVGARALAEDLAKKFTAGEAALTEVRGKLAEIEKASVERANEIKELRQQARQQALGREGNDKQRGLRILGATIRESLCRHFGTEIPGSFKAGEETLLREYRATLEAGAAGGSYLVPTITEAMIIDAIEEVSDLVNRVDFQPGLPGQMDIPTLTGRPSLLPKRTTVDTDMTQSDPSIGVLPFVPNEMYVFFPVDNRLIQMSAVQLGSLATQLIRDAAIDGLASWLVNADGTTNYNSCTGIKAQPAPYRLSMDAGKKEIQNLDKSFLTAMKSAVLKRGRARGSWLLSNDVLGLIEDLDRTGKVPVLTYAQDGSPRVLQNPVVMDESMPDIAESAVDTPFIGFGDLATFWVGLVGGIQIGVSQEVLFKRNQTAFRAVLNGQILRKPVKTFVTGRTAAA